MRWLLFSLSLHLYILLLSRHLTEFCEGRKEPTIDHPEEGMLLSGIKGKALYLYTNNTKRQFPDFYTFLTMGYNMTNIKKMREETLLKLETGNVLERIIGPPPFRPDDYMYHGHCDDFRRMINDLGLIPNLGNIHRYVKVLNRIHTRKKMDILALGGSITAGGYFLDFVRLLKEDSGLDVTVHNHGHGATELTCKLIHRILFTTLAIYFFL